MNNNELFDGENIPDAYELARVSVDGVHESEEYQRYKRHWVRRIEEAHRNSELQVESTIDRHDADKAHIQTFLNDLAVAGYEVTKNYDIIDNVKVVISWADVYYNQI